MHLSKEETTKYLNQLETLKKQKLEEVQRDVEAKKLAPHSVPVIMEQYRVRILDKLYFDTGIEEEDLQMGAILMRVVRRKKKKEKRDVPEKHRLRKKNKEPTPAELMEQSGDEVPAEKATKEKVLDEGEAKEQLPEEETKETVPAEGEVKEKTADEAPTPSEESGEN